MDKGPLQKATKMRGNAPGPVSGDQDNEEEQADRFAQVLGE
jgi:hypothetical protein